MEMTIGAEGSLDAKIAFVGESPSFSPTRDHKAFGDGINQYLIHARILRRDCYLTNIFKVAVSKTKTAKEGTKITRNGELLFESSKGFTSAGQIHVDILVAELKKGGFTTIITLGDAATSALVGTRSVSKWRGSRLWSESIEKKVVPCLHPSSAVQKYTFRNFITHDLKVGMEEAETKELVRPEFTYDLKPSFDQAMSLLQSVYDKQEPVGFDVEVINQELSCFTFTPSETYGFVVPLRYKGGPYFILDQEAEILLLTAKILEHPKIKIVGQNLAFDVSFMFNKYGIVTDSTYLDDTMIAHRIMFPAYPAGLDFITSMYTKEPYYKDEGKQYMKWGGNDEDFLLYNAKDGLVCQIAMPQFKVGLSRQGNLDAYEMQTKLIEPVTYMGQKGLRVHEEGLALAKKDAEANIEKYQEELNSIVGAELNSNSPKQVATYFYIQKGIPPYKNKGRITTDDGALSRIARGTAGRRGYKEAKLILQIRHEKKMIGNYLNVKLRDGRLVCSYSPITGMSRLSSSKDIFGYGTNMQNQPKSMNKYFLADEDYLIYNVDLSQADARSVAYIAPEPRMIKAFEEKADVHSLTAHLLFGIPIDEIKAMDKEGVKCDIGYGDQTHRYWGKKSNHSLNFGMGYKKFSYVLEIPEVQGKRIWEAYHRGYPGVIHQYHAWVKANLGSNNRSLVNAFGRSYKFLDRWGEQLFNTAYAYVPQSNTAEIINRWGLIPFYYDDTTYKEVELLRQVHDSINFQIPKSVGIDRHIEILNAMKKELEQKIVWKTYEYVIPCDFSVGVNLHDQDDLNFNNLQQTLGGYFE